MGAVGAEASVVVVLLGGTVTGAVVVVVLVVLVVLDVTAAALVVVLARAALEVEVALEGLAGAGVPPHAGALTADIVRPTAPAHAANTATVRARLGRLNFGYRLPNWLSPSSAPAAPATPPPK